MNSILKSIPVLLLLASSCKDAPKADEAQTAEAKAVQTEAPAATGYKADLQKSSVKWIGTKPTGRHNGNIMLKEGTVNVENNNIQSGSFVIDLNTMAAYDDDGKSNAKLQDHLKSADFFEVEKYGTATFDITSVQAGTPTDNKDLVMKDATHTVTGNLKIKEIIKSISFPAKVSIADGKVVADAVFNMDRTLWGINYKSDKSLGDKMIYSDVNITVHLEAVK